MLRRIRIFGYILLLFGLLALEGVTESKINTYPRTFTIMEASKTGRTLRLDRGYFDNIRVGDEGEFYVGYDKSQLIGFGEAVKVDNATSYWFFKKVVIGGDFLKGKMTVYFHTKSRRKVIDKNFLNEKDDMDYIQHEFN
jgi:hypothetical protein